MLFLPPNNHYKEALEHEYNVCVTKESVRKFTEVVANSGEVKVKIMLIPTYPSDLPTHSLQREVQDVEKKTTGDTSDSCEHLRALPLHRCLPPLAPSPRLGVDNREDSGMGSAMMYTEQISSLPRQH